MQLLMSGPRVRIPGALPLVLALALAVLAAGPVAANGRPIQIVLAYQPGYSNWGPQNATGVAELVLAEGEVHVSVTGLPHLEQERYAAWLLKQGTDEALAVASFNVEASGATRVEKVLPNAIPEKGWDTMLLTVESADTTPTAPGARRSLVGSFPKEKVEANPEKLPQTGGPNPDQAGEASQGTPAGQGTPWALIVGAIGLLGFGLLLGLWLGGRFRPSAGGRR